VVDGWVVELGDEGDCTYMGILRLSAEAAEDALAQCHVTESADYMAAVSLILREYPCEPVEVERHPIVDIDTQQDSLLAHRDIFPKVKAGIGIL
jgi:choline kinase